MIIFISDLHISDGTADRVSFSPVALIRMFRHLASNVAEAAADDVTIVYLGDIFDIIRSAAWQGLEVYRGNSSDYASKPNEDDWVSPDEKPWGASPCERVPRKIMEKILEYPIFDVLSAPLESFGFPRNTKRVFIPGNHDMIINRYPALRRMAAEVLGIDPAVADKPFKHYFYDEEHRVFARHGHEFDPYNFGGDINLEKKEWKEIEDSEYLKTPIGDVLAAELASAIPGAVRDEFAAASMNYTLRLDNQLKQLFNLRHAATSASFLAHELGNTTRRERRAISAGIRSRVKHVARLPFTKKWALGKFRAREFKQLCLFFGLLYGTRFSISTIRRFYPLTRLLTIGHRKGDNSLSHAIDDFGRLNSGSFKPSENLTGRKCADYVVYGHTHNPEQRLVSKSLNEGDGPDVYLNTGMWRSTVNQGYLSGFNEINHMTYTIIYKFNEADAERGVRHQQMTFELWEGVLSD